MSTEKRVNPAIWAGLMGIGIATVPSCAYAATTAATPLNSVPTLAVGAAVGLLVTVGACVAYASTAKRRRRTGRGLEGTVGLTEFSMPVGDDLQAVGVDVLELDMAPEDQVASLRQVERLALGIEGGVEGSENHEVPSADTAGASRSVREVLSERLDGNGLGMSPVSGRADGTAKDSGTERPDGESEGGVHADESFVQLPVTSAENSTEFAQPETVQESNTAITKDKTPTSEAAYAGADVTGERTRQASVVASSTRAAARKETSVPSGSSSVRSASAGDAAASKTAPASSRARVRRQVVTPEMRRRAAIIANRVPKVCSERQLPAAANERRLVDSALRKTTSRSRALDRAAAVVAVNAAVSRKLAAAVRACEPYSPIKEPSAHRPHTAHANVRHACDESEMPTQSLLTREKDSHQDLELAS